MLDYAAADPHALEIIEEFKIGDESISDHFPLELTHISKRGKNLFLSSYGAPQPNRNTIQSQINKLNPTVLDKITINHILFPTMYDGKSLNHLSQINKTK